VLVWTRISYVSALLLAVPSLQAQPLPSASTILRQQESATPIPVPQRLPAPAVELERPRSPVVAGGPSIRLRSVRVTGAEGMADQAQWTELVQPLVGQMVSAGELLALADRIGTLLKARGWLLAQAFLPPQDVTGGDIEIRIMAGALDGGVDGVVVTGAQRVSAERLRRTVTAGMDPQLSRLNARQLEEGLLRAAELAGVSATASLERGAQSGTSRLTVEAIEAPFAGGGVTLDNFGGPATGVNRLTSLLALNSPLGLGDSLALNLVKSSGIEMLTTQLGLPLGYSGLKLGGSITALRYRVGGDLADLGLQGRAQMMGLNLSYPLLLSQNQKLRVRLGADHKAFVDTALGEHIGDKTASVLSAGISGQSNDMLGDGGMSDWSLGLDSGRIDLSRLASTYEADQAGARAHGAFHKWLFSYTRLQALGSAWTAQMSVNGQLAGKNLESSERFSLGGNSGIRAYPGGEAAGDSGMVASLTIRHGMAWPSASHRLEWSGFYDWGRIQRFYSGDQPVDSVTGLNRYNLRGAGLGLSLARAGSYRVGLIWAHALGSNPGRSLTGANSDGKANQNRLLLSVSVDL
jgi:hemolysin activation/secretion protein